MNIKYIVVFFILVPVLFARDENPWSFPSQNTPFQQKLAPELRQTSLKSSDSKLIVTILIRPGTVVEQFMIRSVRSRILGNIQWVTGEIEASNLEKLAGLKGVHSIVSTETYQSIPERFEQVNGSTDMVLTHVLTEQDRNAAIKGLLDMKKKGIPPTLYGKKPEKANSTHPSVGLVQAKDVHNVPAAWGKGFTGKGVNIAVVDTGVDFGHPDLQGTQARLSGGDYDGWPFAYDTLSGFNYAIGDNLTIQPRNYWEYFLATMFCLTFPLNGVSRRDGVCTATVTLYSGRARPDEIIAEEMVFTWNDTSISNTYRYTVHPDFNLLTAAYLLNLGYGDDLIPPLVIVSDEHTSGVYDTVYVDVDFNQDLREEKPMRRGDEAAGADLYDAGGQDGPDGTWDLSAGMLSWISDGLHPPPGVEVLYPGKAAVPKQGQLICFFGDASTHGTYVTGNIAAQGVITDPEALGNINPLFTGAENRGGAGGPILKGTAPDAGIIAFQNGYRLPYDSWTLAILGFDGEPQTGDEAHIINNSWGSSGIINDGWDLTSRFGNYLNLEYAPNTCFIAATGNGGSGYGTVTSPGGGAMLDVGASTSYGSLTDLGLVTPQQFTWGDVVYWSNRGPGMLGDIAPDVVAVGSMATGSAPLNRKVTYQNGRWFIPGEATYGRFDGTSMSAPLTAGIIALVYQAFYESRGRFPTWEEARTCLLTGCTDLSYDILTQGSGNVDAKRSTDIASGKAIYVEPSQWHAGDFEGEEYPAFPSIVYPGGEVRKTFNLFNPTTQTISLDVSDFILKRIHERTFELSFTSGTVSEYTIPMHVEEITAEINQYDPDLVRVHLVFPFEDFDPDANNNYDLSWRVLFLDWTDRNGDGDLWQDANGNGVVEREEIDIDPETGIYEFNRLSYTYQPGTHLETSIGRDSLSRSHDGIFLALQRRSGKEAVTLKIRLSYYKKTAWPWLELSSQTLPLPPGVKSSFQAKIKVPENTSPGVYQGKIYYNDGVKPCIIPVMVNVAARGPDFTFGASSLEEELGDDLYDNGQIFGAFDWSWRYESGDWRLYYFLIPQGASSPGKKLVIDTQWKYMPTDVNTWVFGPLEDQYSKENPSWFGPYTTGLIGGSRETHIKNGLFRFQTSTGETREIISCDFQDGLHFIALHNVLFSGKELEEPLVGRTYRVETKPYPVRLAGPMGSWKQTFTSGAELRQGLIVETYGLYKPILFREQAAIQDDPTSPCTANWVKQVKLEHCNLLDIETSSAAEIDIDLYVYYDNGDGVWGCQQGGDLLMAESTTPYAHESVQIEKPLDGLYWITVHGWEVSGGDQPFDIDIHAVKGKDLVVENVPEGPIGSNQEVSFDVSWKKISMGSWQGLLIIGTPQTPGVLHVPIEIENLVAPSNMWIAH